MSTPSQSAPQQIRPRSLLVFPEGSPSGYAVRATYDEEGWRWVARIERPPEGWGPAPEFAGPDPYHCLGEAAAWVAARAEGRDLPPRPAPALAVKPVG